MGLGIGIGIEIGVGNGNLDWGFENRIGIGDLVFVLRIGDLY